MGLPEVISVDKSKCQHCLACILVCPVKLCNIVEPEGITVNSDLCIGCGECIRACNEKGHNARTGVDDFPEFIEALENETPLGVLIAPSAAVNFNNHFPQLLTALRHIGVKYVFDVSFGAEITTYLYLKALQDGAKQPIIAQPCPAIVSYIEIYHADLVPYLAPTHSPALDVAIWIKNQEEYKDLKLAFLGPCLAKRREVQDPNTRGIVSYNITFQSLDNYFQEKGLDLSRFEPSGFDTPEAERAVGYSQPGGLTDTFNRFGIKTAKSDIPRVEGPQEVYRYYIPELKEDIKRGEAPILVDILNCQHGCNIGPAVSHRLTHFQVDKIIDKRKAEQIEKYQQPNKHKHESEILNDFFSWLDEQRIDFSRVYNDKSSNRILKEPSLEEEEQLWELMHKNTGEERRINCASCGYGECRGMMLAVFNGLNHIESCKYYLFKENERNLKQVEEQTLEIEVQRDEIAAWNEELEKLVAQRTNSLRNLLNNAGQGFLSFGKNLIVHDEYSAECIDIFGRDIKNKNFAELIYPLEEEQRKFFHSLVDKILDVRDEGIREIYLPLFPKEVALGQKYLNLEFKIIQDINSKDSEVCMAVITDITDHRLLETQIEQERNLLTMVVKVVVNYNDFFANVKDYQHFCRKQLNFILEHDDLIENKVAVLFRLIHTFKGNFSQFSMLKTVEKLHDLESELTEFKNKLMFGLDSSELEKLFRELDMEEWLNSDLARLEEILGSDFLNQQDDLVINKSDLIQIEKTAETLLSPAECKLLIPELRKLRYKPFDTLLKSYPEYVEKLAERYEKQIYPIEIETTEILVNPDRYYEFTKSLVHVFRNAVDHGLESIDERIDSDKEEYGKIFCKVSSSGDEIILTIADDGRGINPEEIREKILTTGVTTENELANYSDEEILQYILKDGFTTKQEVSELSGRGVGLAAVKVEVEKLGGSIFISSECGKGTQFIFTLPLESDEVWNMSMNELMDPLVAITSEFIEEQTGRKVEISKSYEIIKPEKLELNSSTAIITIRGVIESLFVLSLSDEVLREVVRNFVMDELTPEEEEEYKVDVMTEITNIILGNSLKFFPGLEELLVIEAPVSLSSKEGLIKYIKSRIWTCDLYTESGKLSVSLVVPQNNKIEEKD